MDYIEDTKNIIDKKVILCSRCFGVYKDLDELADHLCPVSAEFTVSESGEAEWPDSGSTLSSSGQLIEGINTGKQTIVIFHQEEHSYAKLDLSEQLPIHANHTDESTSDIQLGEKSSKEISQIEHSYAELDPFEPLVIDLDTEQVKDEQNYQELTPAEQLLLDLKKTQQSSAEVTIHRDDSVEMPTEICADNSTSERSMTPEDDKDSTCVESITSERSVSPVDNKDGICIDSSSNDASEKFTSAFDDNDDNSDVECIDDNEDDDGDDEEDNTANVYIDRDEQHDGDEDCDNGGDDDDDDDDENIFDRMFHCVSCGYVFHEEAIFRRHTCRKRKPRRTYTCGMCGKYFQKACVLQVHLKIHYAAKEFICKICSKAFLHKHQLVTHEVIHSSNRPYSCEQCGAKFKRNGHLKRHEMTHTDERSYPCDKCSYKSSSKYAVRRHQMNVHNAERPFSCELCQSSFAERCKLVSHIAKSHNPNKTSDKYKRSMVSCLFCDKRFYWRKHLSTHLQSDHVEEFQKMSIKNEILENPDGSGRRSEPGDPDYTPGLDPALLEQPPSDVAVDKSKCWFCDKTFSRETGLKRHMKVSHTKDYKEACKVKDETDDS